jgi:hypothetical protein
MLVRAKRCVTIGRGASGEVLDHVVLEEIHVSAKKTGAAALTRGKFSHIASLCDSSKIRVLRMILIHRRIERGCVYIVMCQGEIMEGLKG